MPTYDQQCPACEHIFAHVRPMAQCGNKQTCPHCGDKGCRQVYLNASKGRVKVISAGDETTVILNDDNTPYRFKEGTEKGQKAELKRELERREEHLPAKFRNTFNIT